MTLCVSLAALPAQLSSVDLLSPFVGLSLFLFLSLLWLFGHNQKFPPGPPPLPLIGNFAQIDLANPHRTFVAWKHRYGPIFTVWLPKPQVVIAGAKELDQFFLNPEFADKFADRPTHSFLYGLFSNHQLNGDGIILARGEMAQKNRRFALNAFRQLGMGRPRMEARVNLHVNALVRRLAEKATKDALLDDLASQLSFCIGNIIHDLVMGHHYEYNDTEFLHFKGLLDHVVKDVSSIQLLLVDSFPWLRFLLPAFWHYRRAGFAVQKFLLREIDAHIAKWEAERKGDGGAEVEPDDFIDAFLMASRAEGQDWQDPAHKLTLALCAGDLWAGGLETLVTTLTWAVLYLLHYPEVQQKLHRELADHLHGHSLQLVHRKDLPYLRAFLDELLRISNVLPWNLPHSVAQEVTIGDGWTLPRDTLVMPQLGAVHLDPALFPDPELFRPERFLDPQGNYVPSKWLKPFGIGKRKCLGESLAQVELPLVLAALVQNFEFDTIFPGQTPSLRRNAGLTSTPNPFKCIIRLRVDEPILG